jgi:two-component system nitrogen regulation response regulator GlnG
MGPGSGYLASLDADGSDGFRSPLRVPCLTILFHPDRSRVGEIARLEAAGEGWGWGICGASPPFAPPGLPTARGRPLGGELPSAPPLRVAADEDGLRLWPGAFPALLDGDPLVCFARVARPDLERGVVIELGARVVALLHLGRVGGPRLPALGMTGDSEALEEVRRQVACAAALPIPVLVQGESGSGKELVARAITEHGRRGHLPFVAVNMAAVPPSIAASELFGHAPGAFTGAGREHAGHFAEADRGTLFLDEIGAASLEVQAMLLRALETGEVQPLGSGRRRVVDVRIIAATDEDLDAAMRQGRFRSALYHHLAGYVIRVPPLRERREDLGRLLLQFLDRELRAAGSSHLLDRLGGEGSWLAPGLVARLARHQWPGNVRELANVARRLAAAASAGLPVELPVPAPGRSASGQRAPERPSRLPPSRIEERALLEALRASRWRVGATARRLGISRTSLYALIEANPRLRKAKDITGEELRQVRDTCGGDVEAMAERLEASSRGLRLRMRDLGLA